MKGLSKPMGLFITVQPLFIYLKWNLMQFLFHYKNDKNFNLQIINYFMSFQVKIYKGNLGRQ